MKYDEAKEICRAAFADAVKLGVGDIQKAVAMMAASDPRLTEALHMIATESPPRKIVVIG